MFCVFAGFLKIIAPGWGFSMIFLPQGSRFRISFVLEGWGIRSFKTSPVACPGEGGGGGWLSGLELTDT